MIFDPTVKVDPHTVHVFEEPRVWHSFEDGVWDFKDGVIVKLPLGKWA